MGNSVMGNSVMGNSVMGNSVMGNSVMGNEPDPPPESLEDEPEPDNLLAYRCFFNMLLGSIDYDGDEET